MSGLATRMRSFVTNPVHSKCEALPPGERCDFDAWEHERDRCNEARALLRDATPEACAALDASAETLGVLRRYADPISSPFVRLPSDEADAKLQAAQEILAAVIAIGAAL